jgi:hypothetical protein
MDPCLGRCEHRAHGLTLVRDHIYLDEDVFLRLSLKRNAAKTYMGVEEILVLHMGSALDGGEQLA